MFCPFICLPASLCAHMHVYVGISVRMCDCVSVCVSLCVCVTAYLCAYASGLAVILSSEFPSIACVRHSMAPEPMTYDLVAIAKRLGIPSLDKY